MVRLPDKQETIGATVRLDCKSHYKTYLTLYLLEASLYIKYNVTCI